MEEQTVTIPRMKYEKLVADSNWLSCLEDAGIDNWEGIDVAHEMYEENYY